MSEVLASTPITFFDRAMSYVKESKAFDVNGLLKILKSARESEFSSKAHYVYYRRYVVPKLSRLGKKYKVEEEYNSFLGREIPIHIWHDLLVAVSDNYILLVFEVNKEGWGVRRAFRYLLGKDRGRVFVNRIEGHWLSDTAVLKCSLSFGESDIEVYLISDGDVRAALGYTQDSEDSMAFIADGGVFRVQGEIAIRAENTTEEEFRKRIADNLSREAGWYNAYLFCDCLAGILTDLGFTPRFRRREGFFVLIIDDVLSRERRWLDKLALLLGLAKELKRRGFRKVEVNDSESIILVEDSYFGKHRLSIVTGRGGFGNPYLPAEIMVEPLECGEVYWKIREDIESHVRMLERQDYEYRIGNHFLKLENVLGGSVTYVPNIKPLMLREMALRIGSTVFYADEKSKVTITHEEHGTTEVRFLKPFAIEIMTTGTHGNYPLEMNRVALALLKGEEFREVAKKYERGMKESPYW